MVPERPQLFSGWLLMVKLQDRAKHKRLWTWFLPGFLLWDLRGFVLWIQWTARMGCLVGWPDRLRALTRIVLWRHGDLLVAQR